MSFRYLTFCFAALLMTGHFSAPEALEKATWGQVKQQTSPEGTDSFLLAINADAPTLAIAAAAKLYPIPHISKVIGPAGGTLLLNEDNLPGDSTGHWGARLDIPPGALDRDTEISMRVFGDDLSNLVVEFGPSGLAFDRPATLTLTGCQHSADSGLTQLQNIQHITHDGAVEPLPIAALEAEGHDVRIVVDIPGFSRYSIYRRSSYGR